MKCSKCSGETFPTGRKTRWCPNCRQYQDATVEQPELTPIHGETFSEERDGERLRKQMDAVKAIMMDREWHTISELAEKVKGSDAGVSARIRDLRKRQHGGHQVERQYVHRGLWQYRVVE